MSQAIINANVLTPGGFKDRHSVVFDGGYIVDICPDAGRATDIKVDLDAQGMTLFPGFIDVQVNGGGGVLFNNEPSVDGIRAIGEAHRQYGTTGFLPTLISDDPDVMMTSIAAVKQAIEQGVPGVLGIHLEGPYLNSGRKGVHDVSKFGTIGEEQIHLLSSLKDGKTLVTLAPEMTSPDTIRVLAQRGIIVSAGHTEASFDETLTALDAGLTGFTHLFNAMTPLKSRAPGIIAAALQDPRAWCGIIADGHHVHPAMLQLALRAKVGDQMFLVTDAMPSVGAQEKDFSLGALDVHVSDGKCVTANGTLAGSDLDMMSAVRYTHDKLGVDLEQAVRMASAIPAKFLGLETKLGDISVGKRADFVLVDKKLNIQRTWITGKSS